MLILHGGCNKPENILPLPTLFTSFTQYEILSTDAGIWQLFWKWHVPELVLSERLNADLILPANSIFWLMIQIPNSLQFGGYSLI